MSESDLRTSAIGVKLRAIKRHDGVAEIHLLGGPVVVGKVDTVGTDYAVIIEGQYPLVEAVNQEYKFSPNGRQATVMLEYLTLLREHEA